MLYGTGQVPPPPLLNGLPVRRAEHRPHGGAATPEAHGPHGKPEGEDRCPPPHPPDGPPGAAQLPELLRGAYHDGWDPSTVPIKYDREGYVNRFVQEAKVTAEEVPRIVPAVTAVVREHVSPGQQEAALEQLPHDICTLLLQPTARSPTPFLGIGHAHCSCTECDRHGDDATAGRGRGPDGRSGHDCHIPLTHRRRSLTQ
ncbi:DUF2267 domain-containing protein [Streptomyces regalis]|uniref:DUF2267 domain-containing protein n=1 Tax=Streptomyces regalis TaxID=68262 RepID=UPI00099E46E0